MTLRVNFMGDVWGTVRWTGAAFAYEGPQATAIALSVEGRRTEELDGDALLKHLATLPGRTRFVPVREDDGTEGQGTAEDGT